MGCNNNCNCGCGNNHCKGGFFQGYETFWIIVVIAIVIIWVHYYCVGNNNGCNNNGCFNPCVPDCGCNNNCCC